MKAEIVAYARKHSDAVWSCRQLTERVLKLQHVSATEATVLQAVNHLKRDEYFDVVESVQERGGSPTDYFVLADKGFAAHLKLPLAA